MPHRAIPEVFRIARIHPQDVDIVALVGHGIIQQNGLDTFNPLSRRFDKTYFLACRAYGEIGGWAMATRARRPLGMVKTIYDHLGIPKEAYEKLSAQFRDDGNWFHSNVKALRREFSGRYVAVVHRSVFAADRDVERLLQKLEDAQIDPRFTYVDFVRPTPLDFI